uniref:Uncharacterized protein n=1 Tax=Arundo donax TaxID=35708 RepID=A0A0A9E488_ARUDO
MDLNPLSNRILAQLAQYPVSIHCFIVCALLMPLGRLPIRTIHLVHRRSLPL